MPKGKGSYGKRRGRPKKRGRHGKKTKKLARKIWDILNGQDRNFDGKVDIHDKMIEAEEKTNANKKS